MIETCTQVDVRYYVKHKTTRLTWEIYSPYFNGFKSLRNAARALKKARQTHSLIPAEDYKVFKQTRTIEIKTITELEILDD